MTDVDGTDAALPAKRKTGKASRAAGRPAGSETTRAAILDQAREAFAARGYDGASLRAIAGDAGVDPSTVLHFFRSKDELFRAVVQDVAKVSAPLVAALKAGASGESIVRLYMATWDDVHAGAAMLAVIRTAFASEEAMALLRETMTREIIAAMPTTDLLAAELATMQLVGLGIGRHIARLPLLASAEIDSIAREAGHIFDDILVRTK
ncbi:TetR/AcrR family transcriptional regulator [Pleomorphomonas koreensis]|uniref:TetR/AcrR family transcriptional regulator n=1 Tax=Pleomorphomonas koreensis TaxID=257440 RepID=UPI000405FB1D|nr:TetR/AcrR family transcriptional regulator [Pleomorphomonas koreensis]